MGNLLRMLLGACLPIVVFACSATDNPQSVFKGAGGAGGSLPVGQGGNGVGGSAGTIDTDGGGSGDDCSENAKKIFVVSEEDGLYTFDPKIPGLAAYVKLGTLSCNPNSSPQTMGVDRSGTAWVFYSSGDLYKVTTTGGVSCTPTSYNHPSTDTTLGMGFTAKAADSKEQVFYMQSETFGLATIDIANNFAVSMTSALTGMSAELTGGPDGKLFTYEADNGKLSEVMVANGYSTQLISTLTDIAGASAWAFSRYAGVFYVFTGSGFTTSQCSMYDPATSAFSVRDNDVKFTVVGAGQSTCVPPPPIK